jgi:5-methylcytosine-specific restriction endonuclease McrA
MPKGVYTRIKPAWNKGIPMSEEARLKSIISHTGLKASEETRFKQSLSMIGVNNWSVGNKHACGNKGKLSSKKGVPLSLEHNLKNQISHMGQQAWNKIGNGITPIHKVVRNSPQYTNWRTQVFGRDNFTCQECGQRGSWLEVHHVKHFANILKEHNIQSLESAIHCDELWDINNGITLCKKCHNKTKRK